jgi:hypothetical protein
MVAPQLGEDLVEVRNLVIGEVDLGVQGLKFGHEESSISRAHLEQGSHLVLAPGTRRVIQFRSDPHSSSAFANGKSSP